MESNDSFRRALGHQRSPYWLTQDDVCRCLAVRGDDREVGIQAVVNLVEDGPTAVDDHRAGDLIVPRVTAESPL